MEKCQLCGEEKEDIKPLEIENKLEQICDECVTDFHWCRICETRYHYDSTCRHLRLGDFFIGCGCSEIEWDEHKESLLKVLDKIGVDAAKILLHSLRIHKYHHFFSGTILGHKEFNAYWYPEGELFSKNFGYLFTSELTSDEEEEMAVGVQWLMSLWAGDGLENDDLPKTPEADDLTAKWVEEWLIKNRVPF